MKRGKMHGCTLMHRHQCTFETSRLHNRAFLDGSPCIASGNKTKIYRFLQGCALAPVHFLKLFYLALLALKNSWNVFSSLKIIPITFLCINTCEFLIFLATLPKNKKNTSISTIWMKEITFDPFSSSLNI